MLVCFLSDREFFILIQMKFLKNVEWEKVFVMLGIPLLIGFVIGQEYGLFFGLISWFISLIVIGKIYSAGSF